MTTRTLAAILGLAALAFTSSAALAQKTMPTSDTGDAKPMKHKAARHMHMSMGAHHGGRMARGAGAAREASTDALNAQSLQAAQGGQPMAPMAPK